MDKSTVWTEKSALSYKLMPVENIPQTASRLMGPDWIQSSRHADCETHKLWLRQIREEVKQSAKAVRQGGVFGCVTVLYEFVFAFIVGKVVY